MFSIQYHSFQNYYLAINAFRTFFFTTYLGEDVVVDQPRVHREGTHKHNDVPAAEEDVPDFVVGFLSSQRLLPPDLTKSNHPALKTIERKIVHGALMGAV